MNSAAEPAAMVEVELFLASIRHHGVDMTIQEQSKNGGVRRFACVMVPKEWDKIPEGFHAAAMDYMRNVIGLSFVVAREVHIHALEFACGGASADTPSMSELVSRTAVGEDLELRMAVVEHNGVKLAIMQEDKHGPESTRKFARLVIHDRLEGDEWRAYYAAADHYLDTVVELSNSVVMCALQASMMHHKAEMREAEKAEKAEKEARTARAPDQPVHKEGAPAKRFEGRQWGEVERTTSGVRVLYRQTFDPDQVVMKFFNRTNEKIDPDKGDKLWSHCWTAFVPGFNCIHEHAVEFVILHAGAAFTLLLDYTTKLCPIILAKGFKMSDLTAIEVGYYNMEMRGSPPPWNPGAVRVK